MFSAYTLAFCRMVIGIVFAWSFVGKVRDVSTFEETITRFQSLPEWWSRPLAILVLGGELAVVGAIAVGGPLLKWGLLLAAGLLTVFCFALASVVVRGIQASCNCFGSSERSVSTLDIVRNVGFMICVVGGYGLSNNAQNSLTMSNALNWGLLTLSGLIAIAFVVVWAQFREIIQLFR